MLVEKLWPARLKTQGCFVFLPDDVFGKKIAPLNSVSVIDTFCERGPYSPLQLNDINGKRSNILTVLERTKISKTKSCQRDYIVVNTILT